MYPPSDYWRTAAAPYQLGCIFAYQLLLRYNHDNGNHNGRVKWILDTL